MWNLIVSVPDHCLSFYYFTIDKSLGRFTFKNVSVIDYTIASASVFHHLCNFEVIELDPLYSDGHCLLCTTLKYTHMPELQPNTSNGDSHIPRRDGRYSDSFVSI